MITKESTMIGTILAAGSAIGGLAGRYSAKKDSQTSNQLANQQLQQAEGYYNDQLGFAQGRLDHTGEYSYNGPGAWNSSSGPGGSGSSYGAVGTGGGSVASLTDYVGKSQGEFDRYQKMAGPLEDSLSDYYNNLNADEFAAQGNQTLQQQYQNSTNQINDNLAAQGISGGIGAQSDMMMGIQMAQDKSQNIMDSKHNVAQQQQGWLDYTSGQKNIAQQHMGAGAGMQQQAATAAAQMAAQAAMQAQALTAQSDMQQAGFNQQNFSQFQSQQHQTGMAQNQMDYGTRQQAANQQYNAYGNLGSLYGGASNSNQKSAYNSAQQGQQSMNNGLLGAGMALKYF